MWPEIEKALKEKRHELKLLPDNVNKEDIDESLFLCEELNLLQISESKLENVPEKIGRLSNLQNLLLYRNKIHSFPVGIPELAKLKFRDIRVNPQRAAGKLEGHSVGTKDSIRVLSQSDESHPSN